MRIEIIAPSKMNYLREINSESEKLIEEISKKLSSHEIYLVPDKGSVSELFGKKYLENGGKNLFCVIPLDDKEFGVGWVNQDLGQNINCGTWRNQPEFLNEKTDALICIGYSTGGIIEIGYSKWFNKKPVYIFTEFISGKLPTEFERDLDLKYISYKDLDLK